MIDSTLDQEFERSDRQFAVSESRRVQAPPPPARKARLTVAEAAARRQAGRLEVTEASVAVPSAKPVAPADAETALRHARIGLVAVAALILAFVWILQRRKGG